MDHNATQWLAHIADMLGAEASGMLTVHPDGQHSLIANGHSDSAITQYRDHFSHLDPLPQLLEERPAGRAIVLDTTRHPAYLANPELCHDYLRPHGIDHVIAAQWRHPDGTLFVVGVQRFHGSEPFSVGQGQELDRFIHHWRVGNAIPLPEGLASRPANSRRSCDIASQINIPLAVVNANLAVAWANTAAHENPGAAWVVLFEKPGTTAPQARLRQKLKELVGTSLRHRSAAEALVASSDDTWFASATPVDGKPNLALLRLTAMHHLAPGVRCRLEHLYGLTRAEAELTVLLAKGESLEAIAAARAVKLDTVRTQLRTVYKKTGTHRQGELVCLTGALGNG
ncbi:helix-turn-helix transcriptional regulator [Ferribacterium limneticum]|uniref:helix-turn-helix transcriptional regulator n=1 Tax=Ferribacterium limneticum TaxID=76259 RepID=UPI001CFAA09A|nr:hypothetical protein [Ferribacterium limneticum]UCV28929.1 hypothetical protein KI617_02150 [Ferribacterium limneticum]UCV32847.1 hypothetical protein KI608_02150 [Ferribacterium limneticum]